MKRFLRTIPKTAAAVSTLALAAGCGEPVDSPINPAGVPGDPAANAGGAGAMSPAVTPEGTVPGAGGGAMTPMPGAGGAGDGTVTPPIDPDVPVEGVETGPDLPDGVTVGRGLIRRLTAIEYNNTVRDLLQAATTPADLFPPDNGGEGFNKFSGTQTVSTIHLEAYERAAERLVEATFADTAKRAQVVSCTTAVDAACLRLSIETFVRKAWRRPVLATEVDKLVALSERVVEFGGTLEDQLKLALRGVLSSPHFFYLVERDRFPHQATAHRLNSHELASRLSYFLWSTMPDAELFAAADANKLADDADLQAQVDRMLADPKASALTDVFADEWLSLSAPLKHYPHNDKWPNFTERHRLSMVEEAKLFFREILFQERPIKELVGADYTFTDKTLSDWYGIQGGTGAEFMKTSLAGTNRIGGVFGLGGFLMHTSGDKDTSAVKRGVWILDRIMCTELHPPPAPADGPDPTILKPEDEGKTQRETLAKHREPAECAGCHNMIDPIGLGLEQYDAVGQYRTHDIKYDWPKEKATNPATLIDASGTLVTGEAFAGPKELQQLLSANAQTGACVAKKSFVFALGRRQHAQDTSSTENLVSSNDDTLKTVIKNLIQSEAFRARRGQDPDEGSLLEAPKAKEEKSL